MKCTKLTIIFILACAVSVSAQNHTYPNELEGFKIFKNGNWKSLKPFISTKKDVEKVFGKDCVDGCEYDADWRIKINYFEMCYSYSPKEEKSVLIDAENIKNKDMIGKYMSIDFYPRKPIKFTQLKLGKQFEKSYIRTDHSYPSEWANYADSLGLSYRFSEVNTKDGKYNKGDLLSVTYEASDLDYEKYTDKIGC
jgi:hypothetical protein